MLGYFFAFLSEIVPKFSDFENSDDCNENKNTSNTFSIICVYRYTHTQIYTHTDIHIYTHTHIYTYTDIHIHRYTSRYTHTQVYTYTPIHIHRYTHISIKKTVL